VLLVYCHDSCRDQADIIGAKQALGMEVLPGLRLTGVMTEISDLKEVWLRLVPPHGALLALGDTAWNAVIARKVRGSLEEIQGQLRELPNMARQYAAYEYLAGEVAGHLKTNAVIIDLKSQVIK